MSKYMQKNYHTCNRTSMHISVFLWNLQRLHSLAHIMPQLLKRFLELCKNYFLGQFTSFTRKSVLLLYNYTFFFFEVVLSSLITHLIYHSWLQTDLAVSKIQMLSKDEDLPLLKMCLRLWRQFPKRSPKMCMAPYPLPASRLKPSSFSQTSSGSCFCQAPHHSLWRGKALWKACVYLASHFFMSLPLFRLWWYHWNNSWDSPKTKKRAW